MRLKFLFTNFHSTNAGDAAIVRAMLAHFRPLGEITVHCSDPDFARMVLPGAEAEFRRHLWPMFAKAPGFMDALAAGFSFSSTLASALAFRIFGLKPGAGGGALNDFIESDVVVSIGGGFITHDYGFIRPYCDFIVAKALGKRLVLYAQSVGPFRGAFNRLVSRAVLGLADLIIVREGQSARNLRGLGLGGVHTTADAAFSLPPVRKKKAKRMRVAFSPRVWTFQNRSHGARYLSFMKSLAWKIRGEFGADILLVPTTPEDVRFHESLLEGMPPRTEIIGNVLPPERIASELAGADFIVSSRMHPIVLGSLSATPFFAVGWEYKLDELSSMLCGSPCSVHASKADSATEELILMRIRERGALRKQMLARLPEVRAEADRSSVLLKKSLKAWGY
ncbi:MAG: polysaccharide pyruvyl transferase family protein [Candidatus Micrarchaeota archaeon]